MNQVMNVEVKDDVKVGELVDANVEVYNLVQAYKGFMKKTAEGVLGMALTIQKSESLSKEEKKKFYFDIELYPRDSTFKKLKAIGAKYDFLSSHVNVLPPNWTTIYNIAIQDESVIAELIQNNEINPTMTAKQLGEVTGKKSSEKMEPPKESYRPVNNEIRVTLKLDSSPSSAQMEFLRDFVKKAEEAKFIVDTSAAVNSIISDNDK